MGGVLPYKWEPYCNTNGRCTVGFPFLQGLEARKVQRYKWGAYCRTNWRCTPALSSRPVGVGVSETLLIKDARTLCIFRFLGRLRFALFPRVFSRLAFLCYRTPDPRRVSEGLQKGFRRGQVFEGVSRRTLQNPFKDPSKNPFKKVSKSMTRQASRGFKISSRVQGPVAGNESLDLCCAEHGQG